MRRTQLFYIHGGCVRGSLSTFTEDVQGAACSHSRRIRGTLLIYILGGCRKRCWFFIRRGCPEHCLSTFAEEYNQNVYHFRGGSYWWINITSFPEDFGSSTINMNEGSAIPLHATITRRLIALPYSIFTEDWGTIYNLFSRRIQGVFNINNYRGFDNKGQY